MKIIFLDIDGVLNCENAYRNGQCNYLEWVNDLGEKDHHTSFCDWSKHWLNELIIETEAKIVISSTWRMSGIDYMRKVWELEGMSGEIIGITPSFRVHIEGYTIPRGCEIENYLSNLGFYHINYSSEMQFERMQKSGVENYIIIDDDSDMLYQQRNHFIHVLPSPRNKDGFTESHYIQALKVLNQDVISLNY